MKGVFVILDGAADRPCPSLEHMTPLQAAKTPNLDFIAKKSKINYCYPVKEGYIPESDSGIISLLGYDFVFEHRGPLEALGAGVRSADGDLAIRCNFGTIDDLEHCNVLDRRAGRTLTTKEAYILAEAINKEVKLPFPFIFIPTLQHRGVLIIRGGFSDNISAVDENKSGKLAFARALDIDEEAELSAEVVNSFVRQSYRVLNHHPINVARAKKGFFAANVIFCRGAGTEPPKFKKLKGKWIALGYMPLEKGIARATGMDVYSFKYPLLNEIDVYENLYEGLELATKHAVKMLKKYRNKYDYFYVHFKECDIPGHDNKPMDKVKMIEMIDERFFSYLKDAIGEGKLIITSDHSTPCSLKGHSADPVPVLFYPRSDDKEEEQRFSEEQALLGKKIIGRKVLEEGFFKK